MAHIAERNFADYYLGDNVYELAGGLIPELGEHFQVEMGSGPTSEALGALVGAIGKNKALRSNAEVQAVDLPQAVDLVERSGVQQALSRSLWTPDTSLPDWRTIIATGAVANWQDRTALLIAQKARSGIFAGQVILPAGNRVMNSPTEVVNPNVMVCQQEAGDSPKEYEYVQRFIAPFLRAAGVDVEVLAFDDTDKGDEIAARTVAAYREHFTSSAITSYARVANAGIQLAVQFRKVAQVVEGEFDGPENPQIYVETDAFPLAQTPEQIKDPAHFQSPFTALRQVALTAKLLHETAL